jgi:small-conductance mechanosensitive channel
MTIHPEALALSVFGDSLDSIVEFLPRLVGAIVVLVVGLILARVLSRLLARVLLRARLDHFGERVGFADGLSRVGLDRSVSRLVGALVRIFISIFVIALAIGLLGVTTLEEPINEFIIFLPHLIVAVGIIFAGIVVAGYVAQWIGRLADQMGVEGPLGAIAGALVIAIFAIVALAQAGIPTSIFVVLLAIVLGAFALTLTIAFGFGGRGVARELASGRYLGDTFEPGQRVRVADMEGRIERLEGSHALLRDDAGRAIRVPNSLLFESVVVVTEAGPPEPPEGGPPSV